jgi:hypothetical protein
MQIEAWSTETQIYKFNGGSNLSSSQFLPLPAQWPPKMKIAIKVVKID